jgi:ligand-binding sensor domain-containing protein
LWTSLAVNQTPSNSTAIIDQNGYRWQLTGQILKVTDPITNRNRFYSSTFELPGNYINTIALDHDNLLWVGTNNGVAIIIPSKDIFTNNIKPYTPFFQTRRLLLQEVVNKIVIDGGNRKWIATQNGLNLFSASADEQILNFTEENSPLPSKNVIDLAIDDNSGEIFVLTQNGLLSYRTDSSEPSEDLSSVKIFPNPVRPDFQGVLTVSGLRENTAIKITDTAGRLIYETKSNGGTASWDLQNHQAATAIYMVFCVAEDGSESFVGKLAVLR